MQGPGGNSLDGSDQGTPVSTDSDNSTTEGGPSLSGNIYISVLCLLYKKKAYYIFTYFDSKVHIYNIFFLFHKLFYVF